MNVLKNKPLVDINIVRAEKQNPKITASDITNNFYRLGVNVSHQSTNILRTEI